MELGTSILAPRPAGPDFPDFGRNRVLESDIDMEGETSHPQAVQGAGESQTQTSASGIVGMRSEN